MKKIKVDFIGTDGWGRSVFENVETGELIKDTSCADLRTFTPKEITEEVGWLHTVAGNEIDGEPDFPLEDVKAEYLGVCNNG